MRDELRELTASFVTGVLAVSLWSGRLDANWMVLALFFAGALIGGAGWILLVERRFPRPFRRTGRRPNEPGSVAVVAAASFAGFLASEIARSLWPTRGEDFLDSTVGADGTIIITSIARYDIPLNQARGLIAYFGVSLFMFVLLTAIRTQISYHRRRRADSPPAV